MLRRRLLARIGVLIGAFVIGAVVAIWLLEDVLADLDHVNGDALVMIEEIQSIGGAMTSIEAARTLPEPERARSIADAQRRLTEAADRLGAHPIAQAPAGAGAEACARMRRLIFQLLAQSEGFTGKGAGSAESLATTVELHGAVEDLRRAFGVDVTAEQARMARHFRALVLGLTLACLVMVNVAIFVLLRTAQMILRPVGELVAGSRELAAEHFDHRVQVDREDEFGELAHAYNRLAGQLQTNEERKAETLRQLAVTLNHDLNNVLSIIELQLGLVDRQASGNPALTKHLREIRAALARMTGTVASLKNIRRIVLTDYAPGQKMLDLERSVVDDIHAARDARHTAGTSLP